MVASSLKRCRCDHVLTDVGRVLFFLFSHFFKKKLRKPISSSCAFFFEKNLAPYLVSSTMLLGHLLRARRPRVITWLRAAQASGGPFGAPRGEFVGFFLLGLEAHLSFMRERERERPVWASPLCLPHATVFVTTVGGNGIAWAVPLLETVAAANSPRALPFRPRAQCIGGQASSNARCGGRDTLSLTRAGAGVAPCR
jgi:hypothetical protein